MLLSASSSIGLAALSLVLAAIPASAQGKDMCLSLKGSEACPSFQDNFINPPELSKTWGFFTDVTDVASFDSGFEQYLASNKDYFVEKIQNGLQCSTTAARNVTVQWQKTVFCSQFSQQSFDAGCKDVEPALACQSTCHSYSRSEQQILNYDAYCANDNQLTAFQNTTRYATIANDAANCTDFDSPITASTKTCVLGIKNEGSCGYGSSTDQMCAHCDPSGGRELASCCYNSNTDLSTCAMWGHPLAATIRPTQSVATNIGAIAMSIGASSTAMISSTASDAAAPSSTNGAGNDSDNGNDGNGSNNGNHGNGANSNDNLDQAHGGLQSVSADDHVFSGGQLAGIIAGCIIGALLLGGLLALLCFKVCRKERSDPEANAVYRNAPSGSHVERPWSQSDADMVKSPELGNAEKFGAGAAGVGAAAAIGAAAGKSRDSQDDRPISAMSGETGTDGRGTTIPAVRDQYSSHEICPGETVVAIYPYNATLNDEIVLQPDDVVTVHRLYDDGWALGRLESGAEGAFPLVCVTSTKGGTSASGEGDGSATDSGDGAVTADEGHSTDDASAKRR